MSQDTAAFAAKINKILGGDVIVPASKLAVPRRYTSGSLALDVILGGGFPGNLWTEVIGPKSSGKTATLLKAVAANQAADPAFCALWVAAEKFDTDQAQALGVDLARVDVARTQAMELAFQIMIEGTASRDFDMIVLDSYPALVPGEESEKGMDEFVTAAGARLFSKFQRKAGEASLRAFDGSERPFFGVIVNQWRQKVGAFSRFGPVRTSPGGEGKDYFYYTMLDLKVDELLTEKRPGVPDPVKVGQRIKYTTIKNKAAAPQQVATVDFYFTDAPLSGFRRGDYDVVKEYVDVSLSLGVVERAGAYYSFNGEQWKGKDAVLASVREDVDLRNALQASVLALASGNKPMQGRGSDDGVQARVRQ